MPTAILDVLLVQPASGLALVRKHKNFARAGKDEVEALLAKLPADLADPPAGVRLEDQGPFWLGYYHYLSATQRAKTWGPEQLERAGQLLYGDRWQSDLARALGVGDRRVREWAAGDRKPAPGVWADIAALLRQRQAEGMALLQELDRSS
ncbi:hypothetical protein [Achromobacter sp. 413638]|uniref:hypothetical protein n=1 Tax=Achromobacter sp. 413638 TaxID=3342385 RepID=UPI00370BCAC6